MVASHQLGQVGWRSSWWTSIFGLLCQFYGHNLPENAIRQAFLAIGGPSVSKWLDLSGSWLDLGGKIILGKIPSIIAASPEPPMARNARFMAFLGHF